MSSDVRLGVHHQMASFATLTNHHRHSTYTPPKRRTFRFYGFPSGKNFLFFFTYGPRNLVREKLGKNESKAALHRSHRCRRSMVISSSPSSCDSTGISTVQILALVAEI